MAYTLGILLALLSSLLWAIADSSAAFCSRKGDELTTLFWSHILGFPLYAALYFILRPAFDMTAFQLLLILLAAIIMTAGAYYFYRGLRIGEVSVVTPISASNTVLIILLSLVFFREHISLIEILEILLIILGVFMISTNKNSLKKLFSLSAPGTKEALLTVFLWGIGFFMVVYVLKQAYWFFPMFLFFTFICIFSFIQASVMRVDVLRGMRKSLTLPLLVLAGAIVFADFAYATSLTLEKVALVSPLSNTYPLFVIMFGYLFYKERLDLIQKCGAAFIIGGLILLSL